MVESLGRGSIPDLDYVIQSYDTAYSKKETADYSAVTTWGVFQPYRNGDQHLILMDAKKGRWNFPELKANCTGRVRILGAGVDAY